MEWTGMLVVSLRGVNFGFWSRLGCSGQNVIIFGRQGLLKGCTRRNNKNRKKFDSLYLLNSYKQSFPLSKVQCNKMSLSIVLQECKTKLDETGLF